MMNELKEMFNEEGRISAFITLKPNNLFLEVHMHEGEIVKEYLSGERVKLQTFIDYCIEDYGTCNIQIEYGMNY